MQHAPLQSFPSSSTSTSGYIHPTPHLDSSYTSFHPGNGNGNGTSSSGNGAGPSVSRKRSTSPIKYSASAGQDGEGGRPVKMMRPTLASASGTGDGTLNMRAEEEAARRYNTGRPYTGPSTGGMRPDPQGRISDLFSRSFLRERVSRLTRDANTTLDEEALAYLSQAAEQRLRALLTSSVRAHTHRTQTSHHRPPPFAPSHRPQSTRDEDEDDAARPMWSHVVTSDVNAVMEALARQNKEAELGFRASRMDRIAREAEMARIREMREARARETGQSVQQPQSAQINAEASGSGQGSGGGSQVGEGEGMDVDEQSPSTTATSATPATPREKPNGTSSTPAPAAASSTPVFGAVKERPLSKKKKGKGEVSAETAHKMSNLTAMRATGVKMGKYSWLNNAPNVSSPLAGRKKKAAAVGAADADGKKGDEADAPGEADAEGEEDTSSASGSGMKRERSLDEADGDSGPSTGLGAGGGPRKKSKLSQSISVDTDSPATPAKPPKKKKRPKITIPARRLVPVMPAPPRPGSAPSTSTESASGTGPGSGSGPSGAGGGSERRMVPDDQALTAVDVMFALEREGTGRGMGTAEEIIWRCQGTAGGVWGKEVGEVAPRRL